MLPEWLAQKENYQPLPGGSGFAAKLLQTMGKIMARLTVQDGQENCLPLPPLLKLLALLGLLLVLAVAQQRLPLLAVLAFFLAYLSTCSAKVIGQVLRAGLAAGALALLLLLPALLLQPAGRGNYLLLAGKVFLSAACVSCYNHTTQWNRVTQALKQLRVPGLFIFTLDITLKYIVWLGRLVTELLTALQLREVGKTDRPQQTWGGVLGVTLLRGTEMNRQLYEAMQCRCFTDDYEGLRK